MVVLEGPTRQMPDGENLAFCGRKCALQFELLGPSARLRAEIVGQRADIIDRLQAERGSRVITLIHRREPWIAEEKDSYITLEDSEAVVAAIRSTPPDMPIDLIVHTPGGVALAAELIAMALKHHAGSTTVIVPFYAMSGGSLIALAADEILLERESILGPVDPLIGGFPAGTVLRLLARKPIETITDEMIILAEGARQSLDQMKEFVKWLLEDKLPKREREALSVFLTGGYISHDTPIVMDVLRSYGLPVREGVPESVYDLFRTFVFGACERPGASTY
jgi:ClpP class serine protease